MKYRVLYNFWLFRLPGFRNYYGLTVGHTILFRDPESMVTRTMRKHEEIHVEQIDRYGVPAFYALYFWCYLRGLCKFRNHAEAYRRNPLEEEAYRRETET